MRAASAVYKTPLWTEYFSLDVPVGWISESTYCTLFLMKSDHEKDFFFNSHDVIINLINFHKV